MPVDFSLKRRRLSAPEDSLDAIVRAAKENRRPTVHSFQPETILIGSQLEHACAIKV